MKKFVLLSIIFILVLSFAGCSFFGEDESDNSSNNNAKNFYIGEVMAYEDVKVVVNGLTEKEITTGQNIGCKNIIVSVTISNNKKADFNFPYSDVYIKTVDSNQEYEVSVPFGNLFGDSIMSGASKSYEMEFVTPYSYKDKKFKIMFDWGWLSPEKEYFLYMRDGSNYNGGYKTEEDKYLETLSSLRDDIYEIFRLGVYDKISGSMYYSDIQTLIDMLEGEVKARVDGFYIYFDLSYGSYHPQWVARINGPTKAYNLFYIKVDLNSNFRWTNKYIGKCEL